MRGLSKLNLHDVNGRSLTPNSQEVYWRIASRSCYLDTCNEPSQVKATVDLTSMRRAKFRDRDNSQQTKNQARPLRVDPKWSGELPASAKCRPVAQGRRPITTRPTVQGRGFQPVRFRWHPFKATDTATSPGLSMFCMIKLRTQTPRRRQRAVCLAGTLWLASSTS
jgi:hypothetical protein